MKTCPNCKTIGIHEDAKFCPNCGIELNVPEAEENSNLFKDVSLHEFSIPCSYGINSTECVVGDVTISSEGLIFEQKNKGGLSFLTSLATLGNRIYAHIRYNEISAMGIMEKGRYLFVASESGDTHVFGGPTLFGSSENVATLRKIAHIAELYRRMFWYYGGFAGNQLRGYIKDINYYTEATERVDDKTNEELINFFKRL